MAAKTNTKAQAGGLVALDPKLVCEALARSENNFKVTVNKPKDASQSSVWFTLKLSLDDGKTWNELIVSLTSKSVPDDFITVSFGAADPNNQTGQEKTYRRSFTVNAQGGSYYFKAIEILDRLFKKKIEQLKTEGKFNVTDEKKFDIVSNVKTKYSMKSKKIENRGKPLENPTTSVALEFGKNYPIKHPIVAFQGKPMCTIINMDEKPEIGKDGKPIFKPATVDGAQLNQQNAWKVVTSGSIIVGGYVVFNASYVNDNVNLTARGHLIRIKPNIGGDINEGDDYEDYAPQSADKTVAEITNVLKESKIDELKKQTGLPSEAVENLFSSEIAESIGE